jgi:hypothetical protein
MREQVVQGCRLMTTTSGRLGWAHPLALPGDKISILAGCSLPVILRPFGGSGHYHLVGDAYAPEIMDGKVALDRLFTDINIH